MSITISAEQAWRNYITDGVPGSGDHPPIKADIRTWGQEVEQREFDTRTLFAADTMLAGVNIVRTGGYTTAGDGGGATYKRVGSEPSHNLKVQSADGAWWELVPDLAGLGIKQAGCLVDGATDDTTAFQSAAIYAADNGITLLFPAGECLLTDGFTTQANGETIRWVGQGRSSENTASVDVSRIRFAPTATTKYLLNQLHRGYFSVSDIVIQGVDPVDGGELKLFRFNQGGAAHNFTEVDFEGNHHWSLYYDTSCTFQSSSLTNVQWRNCGTIGSAGTALKGTLLNLNNVNHEALMPANTQKVVMDLRGVRHIAGTNVLLEGALPASGWIILRIDHGASVAGINSQSEGCSLNGFWSEWTGNNPLYTLSVNGSVCNITMATGLFSSTVTMFLDNAATVTLKGISFMGSGLDYDARIAVFGDIYSKVVLENCRLRGLASSRSPQISYVHCLNAISDSVEVLNYEVTTVDNEVLYEWNGGLVNANSAVTHPAVSAPGHLRTIVTDATYGRIINITKNVANSPVWDLSVVVPAEWAGMTLMVEMLAHVPTLSGQTFHQFTVVTLVAGTLEAVTGDGTYKWYQLRVILPSGAGGTVKFKLINDASNSSTDLKIAALRVSLGDGHGRFPKLVKPINVRSFASAFPTTGTWVAGDRVINTAPTASGTISWLCVSGGSPGTWVEERGLANQASNVSDPTGGGNVDTEGRSAINDILDILQAQGFMAAP